jgi:hypothetical protein
MMHYIVIYNMLVQCNVVGYNMLVDCNVVIIDMFG